MWQAAAAAELRTRNQLLDNDTLPYPPVPCASYHPEWTRPQAWSWIVYQSAASASALESRHRAPILP